MHTVTSSPEELPCSRPSPMPYRPLQRATSINSVVLDPEQGPEGADSVRKLPSSQYKGVVPQPNGRWGAQIYEKHQRVWLGTFNEETDAAKAYDVAAHRFRGRDAVTNFAPLTDETTSGATELLFLASRSKAEIVDMLRKHTYHDELQQSKLRCSSSSNALPTELSSVAKLNYKELKQHHLFDKAVTPSDVGKLNRLVIPKQHAEKHFPMHQEACKGLLLNFEDRGGKVWRFRYSYWNSSQSYVLTKGWSRFVKEKGLKAGDVISFRRSAGEDRQLFIEWRACSAAENEQVVRLFGVDIGKVVEAAAVAGGKRGPLGSPEVVMVKKQCIEAL